MPRGMVDGRPHGEGGETRRTAEEEGTTSTKADDFEAARSDLRENIDVPLLRRHKDRGASVLRWNVNARTCLLQEVSHDGQMAHLRGRVQGISAIRSHLVHGQSKRGEVLHHAEVAKLGRDNQRGRPVVQSGPGNTGVAFLDQNPAGFRVSGPRGRRQRGLVKRLFRVVYMRAHVDNGRSEKLVVPGGNGFHDAAALNSATPVFSLAWHGRGMRVTQPEFHGWETW